MLPPTLDGCLFTKQGECHLSTSGVAFYVAFTNTFVHFMPQSLCMRMSVGV